MKSAQNGARQSRILFRLKKDEDGYPPDDWESLWASEAGPGLFLIDNVPFYVRGISWGDVVSAEPRGGELHFKGLARPSDHSVLRVIVYDESEVESVRAELGKLHCETEKSHVPGLISVDVPPSASLDDVLEYLKSDDSQERWDYEEASLRHPRT